MSVNFVVEGRQDERIIEKVLSALGLGHHRFVLAGGGSRLDSIARSMLVRWPQPLLVVTDADSNDAEQVEERKRELRSYLSWPGGTPPFEIVMPCPEIEVVLFATDAWVQRLVGRPLTAADGVRARLAPRGLVHELARHAQRSAADLIEALSTDEWRAIAQHEVMRQITDFVREHGEIPLTSAIGHGG